MPGSSAASWSLRCRRVLRGGCIGEGDEADAAPDGFVGAADFGFVVGGEPRGELGLEFEVFLAHEAGGHGVAAGHAFDEGFVESAAFADFDCADEPGAAEAGDVVGDAFVFGEERFGWCLLAVVAEELADGFEEGAFAVGALPPEDEEDLGGVAAEEAVAEGAVEEVAGVWVWEDAFEEAVPGGGAGGGVVEAGACLVMRS